MIAASVLVLGTIAAGLYLYLVPGVSANTPSDCTVGLPAAGQIHSAGLSPEPCPQGDSKVTACSQEMVDLTSPGDTLFSLLHANLLDEAVSRKVASSLASEIQKSTGKLFDTNTPLPSDRRYAVTIDQNGGFLRTTLEIDPANVFHAAMEDCSIRFWREEVVLDYKIEAVSFKMKGNLVDSVTGAGEGEELAAKLSNVFQYDIDFQYDSKRGDICTLLFERRYADDRPSGYGRILYAMYEGRQAGTKTAVLFNSQYHDINGSELKKPLLRTPLKHLRRTSPYGNRVHPIFRERRMHWGVDYGAPARTPVYSVANGTVTFCGWQNGYGNYVCIKHDNGYESRYGHLHSYAHLLKTGKRVKQGEKIGLVGQTGRATGPHLDFQLLVKGGHVDPARELARMVQSVRAIAPPLMPRFRNVTQERMTLLSNSGPVGGSDRLVATVK
jgi:murein DD-endopeptidase MepM/ murein hydrolase activator NlpD